jgi:DNA end-binding protein Ku
LPDEELDEQSASNRPFWSGTITFGLVSIPVNLFPANRGDRVSLRMLGPNGKPLARRYYSEQSGRDLDAEDIVRGYEIKKDRFVDVTDEELERLAPERSRDINLRRFVDDKSIPRLYFERGYFLAPAGSTRAYHLLAQTMERTGRAGIATFVMRGKEYLVAITADNGILRAETMRFADEIRAPEAIGLPKKEKATPAALRVFERVITGKSRTTLPTKELRDEDAESLRKLIQRKRKSEKNIVSAAGRRKAKAEVVDLLEVLRQSLGQADKRSRKRAKRSH